jgi:AAA family ATP:ADP antiporter
MIALNPLFAALVKRLPRVRFISLSYRFFAANLLVFAALFALASPEQNLWVGRAFFIWLSIFNLFVVSVFWALMVDVFDSEQGKRLFGFIAAGATLGAIAGSTITISLVREVGPTTLFFASILLLELAVFAVRRLSPRHQAGEEAPIGGSVLAGISHTLRSPYLLNVCVFLLLFTVTSTFLYFQQATIARDYFADRASRTAFFAQVDLLVNALTLAVQLFFTARILRRFGVALTLGILPLFTLLGFAALAAAPVVAVVVAFQVLRRAANFALARPTRELLYTVVAREDKYKAKSFIDTVVYRAGDQVGSWSYLLLSAMGLGIGGVALVAVPLSALWLLNSLWLGRRQARLAVIDCAAQSSRHA